MCVGRAFGQAPYIPLSCHILGGEETALLFIWPHGDAKFEGVLSNFKTTFKKLGV